MMQSHTKIKDFLQKQPAKIPLYSQQRQKCAFFRLLYVQALMELAFSGWLNR